MRQGCKVSLTVIVPDLKGLSVNSIELSELELDVLNHVLTKLELTGFDFSELESAMGIPQDTAHEAIGNVGDKFSRIIQMVI